MVGLAVDNGPDGEPNEVEPRIVRWVVGEDLLVGGGEFGVVVGPIDFEVEIGGALLFAIDAFDAFGEGPIETFLKVLEVGSLDDSAFFEAELEPGWVAEGEGPSGSVPSTLARNLQKGAGGDGGAIEASTVVEHFFSEEFGPIELGDFDGEIPGVWECTDGFQPSLGSGGEFLVGFEKAEAIFVGKEPGGLIGGDGGEEAGQGLGLRQFPKSFGGGLSIGEWGETGEGIDIGEEGFDLQGGGEFGGMGQRLKPIGLEGNEGELRGLSHHRAVCFLEVATRSCGTWGVTSSSFIVLCKVRAVVGEVRGTGLVPG